MMFTAVVVTSLLGTLFAPLMLLALGPIVWGVPHVVSDIRYLVVRTGYGQRRPLWLLAGVPLLWDGLGGDLVWGFVGAAAVALVARTPLRRRLLAAASLLLCGAAFVSLGSLDEIVFGHLHNVFAVALWWMWRRRRQRLHWIPIVVLVMAMALLLSPLGLYLAREFGGMQRHPLLLGPTVQLWRLAPGLPPNLGLRLVLAFCLMQSVHYAMWLHMLPDEARGRSTTMSFRASYRDLRRDLGLAAIVIAAIITAGIAAWSLLDIKMAGDGYFRMVRFHGLLEVMAGVLLVLERPARPRPVESGQARRSASGPAPREHRGRGRS